MDKQFFDGASFAAAALYFWDWFTGNLALVQDFVGIMVGLATLTYTLIRCYQRIKYKK